MKTKSSSAPCEEYNTQNTQKSVTSKKVIGRRAFQEEEECEEEEDSDHCANRRSKKRAHADRKQPEGYSSQEDFDSEHHSSNYGEK